MPCYLKELEEEGVELSEEEKEELKRELREVFGEAADLCELTHDSITEALIKDYVKAWVARRRRRQVEEALTAASYA